MENEMLEITKVCVPVIFALIILWVQIKRNQRLQAESTFFNLLNSIRNLVASTKGQVSSVEKGTYENKIEKEFSGTEYFKACDKELQDRLMKNLGDSLIEGSINQQVKDERSTTAFHEGTVRVYNQFFVEHLSELGHYFRFVYNVISFVDSHKHLSRKKKVQYINFIQAQMSESELQLLYFNGVGRYGAKLYKLMDDYEFLQNIGMKNRGFIEMLDKFYPKTKFRFQAH